jgi:hypothetical protein
VRLEITRGLRDDLNKRQLISEAVQAALIKITEKVQPQRHEGTKI